MNSGEISSIEISIFFGNPFKDSFGNSHWYSSIMFLIFFFFNCYENALSNSIGNSSGSFSEILGFIYVTASRKKFLWKLIWQIRFQVSSAMLLKIAIPL